MPKLKSHKGLLKRVRITGRGKVKYSKSFTSHLKSNKTGKKIRHLDQAAYVTASDIKRLEMMLHRPLTRGDAR